MLNKPVPHEHAKMLLQLRPGLVYRVLIFGRTSPHTDNDGNSQLAKMIVATNVLQRRLPECTFELHPTYIMANEVSRCEVHESIEFAQLLGEIESLDDGSNVIVLVKNTRRLGDTRQQVDFVQAQLVSIKDKSVMVLPLEEAFLPPGKVAAANGVYTEENAELSKVSSKRHAGISVEVDLAEQERRERVEKQAKEIKDALLTGESEYNDIIAAAVYGSDLDEDEKVPKLISDWRESQEHIKKALTPEKREQALENDAKLIVKRNPRRKGATATRRKEIAIYCRRSKDNEGVYSASSTLLVQGLPAHQMANNLAFIEDKYGLKDVSLTIFFDDGCERGSLCNKEWGKFVMHICRTNVDLALTATPARQTSQLEGVALMKATCKELGTEYEFSEGIGQDWVELAESEVIRRSLQDDILENRKETVEELRSALVPKLKAISEELRLVAGYHFNKDEHSKLAGYIM